MTDEGAKLLDRLADNPEFYSEHGVVVTADDAAEAMIRTQGSVYKSWTHWDLRVTERGAGVVEVTAHRRPLDSW